MMYKVRWEIDVNAKSATEAARTALDIQRNSDSIATVFEVQKHNGKRVSIIDIGENK